MKQYLSDPPRERCETIEKSHEHYYPHSRQVKIPEYCPSPDEISKQMRLNASIIMEDISKHVDKELDRLRDTIKEMEMEYAKSESKTIKKKPKKDSPKLHKPAVEKV
jgi:hypothetical protein